MSGTRAGLVVSSVVAGSPAEGAEVQAGERILTVNGLPVRDLIDFRYLAAERVVDLEIGRPQGAVRRVRLAREPGQDLGLAFDRPVWGAIRRCCNRCVFCFVDQLPPGLRSPLYVKDDDYRLSFLHSTFITMTNLRPADWERLERLRLSPLYVSVHTTNPALRARLLGHPRAGSLFQHLSRLDRARIDIHAQVVLCPGLNDGPELDRTLEDLGRFGPRLLSAAVVPVGLTRHRAGLYPLRPVGAAEADAAVRQVERWARAWRRWDSPSRLWASDELYLLSGRALPPSRHYGFYPQFENGVGLVRSFLEGWASCRPPVEGLGGGTGRRPFSRSPRRVAVVTGALAAPLLKPAIDALRPAALAEGREIELLAVTNRFLGETVTVAGLLCGRDIERALAGRPEVCEVLLPAQALDCAPRAGTPAVPAPSHQGRFLDGVTLDELEAGLGVPVRAVEPSAPALLAAMLPQGGRVL